MAKMNKRVKELEERLAKGQKGIAKYVQHTFDTLDTIVEEHRKTVAHNAIAGVKPNGLEERIFYEHINKMKQILVHVLEKTIQDFEHQGDKYWDKHFRDGIIE